MISNLFWCFFLYTYIYKICLVYFMSIYWIMLLCFVLNCCISFFFMEGEITCDSQHPRHQATRGSENSLSGEDFRRCTWSRWEATHDNRLSCDQGTEVKFILARRRPMHRDRNRVRWSMHAWFCSFFVQIESCLILGIYMQSCCIYMIVYSVQVALVIRLLACNQFLCRLRFACLNL